MSNPLFNQFGNTQQTNGINQIWQDAQKLKQSIQNPKAEVERLLQSGAMSQSQFSQLSQMAHAIIGGRK